MLFRRNQVVAWRDLEYPIKKRAHLMATKLDRVINGLGIPTGGHSGGKQGLDLRRQIQRLLMEGVEQRLDAEPIAGGEDCPVGVIPKYESKFAAQAVQTLRAEVFIEMESNLAVRPGT